METFSEAAEDAIIKACEKHQEENWRRKDYRAFIFTNDYFVKFGDYETLWPKILTHRYVAAYAESLADTSRPRVPKVLHHIEREERAYLVLEKIELSHSPPDLSKRMLEAVTWLAKVPPPQGHVLGPLGDGRIRHSFFKNNIAPFDFRSVQDLQYYMNQGRRKLSKKNPHRKVPIRITGERLLFTQPDMHDTNFGVDEQGKTILLDFGEIAYLPESFARFTLSSEGLAPIVKSLNLSGESNMTVMSEVAYVLGMTSDPNLGLDTENFPGARES